MADDQHRDPVLPEVPPEGGGPRTNTSEPRKSIPPAAARALAEADERRRIGGHAHVEAKPERGGRGGLDPVRYDDWEIKGRAVDF